MYKFDAKAIFVHLTKAIYEIKIIEKEAEMSRGRKSKYIINEQKSAKWNAALYLRLSSEDGDKAESTSIESQKHLLEDYLKNDDNIKLFDYYVDDGYSGTDFNRPGFKRLFEDMKSNKFNTIIVKDLSRLGRNYIEAGNYIEQIFPLFNIRFIAVNDNIDSYMNPKSISELNMPLKNLINDEYARDISKKVSSALKTMRKQGLFTCGLAPYGYIKDPNDKHHLIIDEEVADNVRTIYRLYLNGYGTKRITNYLNENNIINPSGYRKFHRKDTNKIGYFWTTSTVSKILDNQMYCGDMVQGKTRSVSYKIHKETKIDKNEWDIVPNTHEPIIDRYTWKKVQELRKKSFMELNLQEKEKSLFTGKLKCADCGYAMRRQYRTKNRNKIVFECSTHSTRSKEICKSHAISEEELKKIVWKVIKQQIRLNENKSNTKIIQFNNNKINKCYIELNKENEKMKQYKQMKMSLYEDWKLGNISEEEYKDYLNDYTDKISNVNKNIEYIKQNIDKTKENRINSKDNSMINNFATARELTHEMVDSLIDTIEIYEDKTIKINFKYKDEYKNLLKQLNKEVCYGEKI